MIDFRICFVLALVSIGYTYCGQTTKSFAPGSCVVDSSIRNQIRNKNAHDVKSMVEFKLYKNDIIDKDAYPDGTLDGYMTQASRKGDTVTIIGIIGSSEGFGFVVTLSKDTCKVRYFPKSRQEIYKLHSPDSLSFGFFVPCKTYKLTLAEPVLNSATTFRGMVELISEDYYEVINGKERRCSMQLRCFFTAEIPKLELFMPKDGD